MNIENRVTKLEDRIGVNQTPETLKEMWEKFNRGEYGNHTTMSIVAAYLSAPEKTHFFEGMRRRFPEPLVDYFQSCLEKEGTKKMEPDRA